jgi:hypothetical protein
MWPRDEVDGSCTGAVRNDGCHADIGLLPYATKPSPEGG